MNTLLALLYSSIIPVTIVLIVWFIAKNRKTTPNIYFACIIILCNIGNIILVAMTEMLIYNKLIIISIHSLSIIVVMLRTVKKQIKTDSLHTTDKDKQL